MREYGGDNSLKIGNCFPIDFAFSQKALNTKTQRAANECLL